MEDEDENVDEDGEFLTFSWQAPGTRAAFGGILAGEGGKEDEGVGGRRKVGCCALQA